MATEHCPHPEALSDGASASARNPTFSCLHEGFSSRVINAVVSQWQSFWSMPGKPGTFLGWPATLFILAQMAGGLPLLPYAILHWHTDNSLRFGCFLVVALSASLFKVRLPGIQ